MITEQQATLKDKVRFSGVGIHTGEQASVTVYPAPENSGRRFLVDGVDFPARIDHVLSCDRCTVLGKGEVRVHTPEHLLAALAGLGIDNAVMEMDGPEVPILDGGSIEFCEAFQAVGIETQKAPAKYLKPDRPYSVRQDNGALVLVTPSEFPVYEYILHYDHPMIGCQTAEFRPAEDDFATQIAPARTFALWEEVKPSSSEDWARAGTPTTVWLYSKITFRPR